MNLANFRKSATELWRNNWFTVLVFLGFALLVSYIGYLNISPDTWLSGWDNLHPEFNFSLNVQRSFFAVWQEYQGLGLLGGMSHAADLPHQLSLWIFSLFIPANLLRYFFTLLLLFIGTCGSYVFAADQFQSKNKDQTVGKIAALAAACFYLFNLATVQNFYVPYESFSYFFAFLPWLLWILHRTLTAPSKKNYILLLTISLLATPAFYVQTLFVVFAIISSFFVVDLLLQKKAAGLKNLIPIALILFATNAFWLIPSLYFTVTSSWVTVNAKINRIATPESQFMNKGYGDIGNIAKLKGYWFNYSDYSFAKGYYYLMEPWKYYLAHSYAEQVTVVLFIACLIGTILSIIKFRQKTKFVLPLLFVTSIIMLSAGEGIPGLLFSFFSKHVPLFSQMFRTTFTKWSTAAALAYSWGLGSLIFFAGESLNGNAKWKKALAKIVSGALAVTVIAGAVYTTIPIFNHDLFYVQMESKIPTSYFDLMKYFQQQPAQSRIALLPLSSFWGWHFYDWNYRGSGFLWYGIEQPILDRTFDVWSPYDETFYTQLDHAIKNRDADQISSVLKQYQVSYLVVDKSEVTTNSDSNQRQVMLIEEVAQKLGYKKSWENGALEVFDLTSTTPARFISSPSTFSFIQQDTIYGQKDNQFIEFGNYVTEQTPVHTTTQTQLLPFSGLNRVNQYEITYQDDSVIIHNQLSNTLTGGTLTVPGIPKGTVYSQSGQVSYIKGEVSITFPEFATLTVGSQKITPPQIPSIHLQTKSKLSSVQLLYGDQEINVERDAAPKTHLFTYLVGQPITLTVQDSADISSSYDLSESFWSELMKLHSYALTSGTAQIPLELKIYSPANKVAIPDKGDLSFKNCDIFKRGSIDKKATSAGTTFTARDSADTCDGVYMSELRQDQAFLLRIAGKNLTGRSLKFYLDNVSARAVTVEELLAAGSFDQTYSIPSWKNQQNNGYFLGIDTQSYGAQLSQNTVSLIETRPIPADWISKWKFTPASPHPQASDMIIPPKISNIAVVMNTTKFGTSFYLTKIKGAGSENIVTLFQGYDKGWLAVSGGKLLEHTQYNGWANAWFVPNGDSQVFIFYWPQFLEFAGFILLLVGGVMVAKQKSNLVLKRTKLEKINVKKIFKK